MIEWDDEQLRAAGLDRRKVESIARRLSRISTEMRSMGLHVYGASGSGHLVHESRPTHKWYVNGLMSPDFGSSIAYIGQGFDGGDW